MADAKYNDMPRSFTEAKASGAKHYFTGAACSRGHAAPRFTSSQGCIECARENEARKRHGSLDAAKQFAAEREQAKAKNRTCGVDGCGRPQRNRGLCDMHVQRLRKTGDAGDAKPRVAGRGEPTLLHCGKAQCMPAKKIAGHMHFLRNRATYRSRAREAYWADPAAAREGRRRYASERRHVYLAKTKRWKEQNPERYRANNARNLAKYREHLRQATPQWAAWGEIDAIYAACPKGMHVDHVIPVRCKTASGLHVPVNLQYLTESENTRKRNELPPDADEQYMKWLRHRGLA